jgi:hypothetical protein
VAVKSDYLVIRLRKTPPDLFLPVGRAEIVPALSCRERAGYAEGVIIEIR